MAFSDGLSLKEHLQIVTLDDLVGFAKVALSFVPGRMLRLRTPDIWVVSETADTARDNGYWFFRYMRKNHPKRPVYYPIRSTSADYHKVQSLGNVVEYGSFRHFVLYWAAKTYIGTTKQHGYPHERVCMLLALNRLVKQKYVFLNHGFARGYSKITDALATNYSLFFAMSELEKKIVVNLNHQPPERVHAIGFCRHDNLNDELLDKRLVLFMPTWRMWLDYRHKTDPQEIEETKRAFLSSSYYAHIQELLNSKRLATFLDDNDLRMIVYLHGYAQIHAYNFSSGSPRIELAPREEDVQTLLKRAAYLITDYSSIVFDYAYMKKPCCYYQFDAQEFTEHQYAESEYYTYEDNGFGPVLTTLDEVLDNMEESFEQGFVMPELYRQRVESFFPSFGTDHCQQTFEIIDKL